MCSHAELVWALIPMATVLIRKGRVIDREIHKTEGHVRTGAEMGFILAQTKEGQELLAPTKKLEEARKEFIQCFGLSIVFLTV